MSPYPTERATKKSYLCAFSYFLAIIYLSVRNYRNKNIVSSGLLPLKRKLLSKPHRNGYKKNYNFSDIKI